MAKKRILIVDDDTGVTRTLGLYLEDTGLFDVKTENQGSNALVVARTFKPDLIFLDIVMPDADGADIAAQIKADASLEHTPIVFLTALVSRQEVSSGAGQIGGHPFLAKPVDPETIISCIHEHTKS